MKILIIGGGNMGLTYARSFLRSHITTEANMMILEKSPEKAAELSKLQVGSIFSEPDDCLQLADLVILAVKPQDAPRLFESLRRFIEPQQVFLSIMAGMKMATIQSALGISKVIRAMPNLPAQIGMGMTAFTASEDVTRIELVMVQNLLNTTGKTLYVEDESAIDATTAISGSGPAYVFYFMDALMTAAREMGFSESEAELLVSQLFRGTVELYNKSDLSCQDWIARVSSRGGTTEAAMQAYRERAVHEDIIAGAAAALQRAIALGQEG
ncbi:MAG: pyrroline-5-carboxylate reductase, partial [Lewinella sp.]|nr:pyrroline-5-carboxylate reductase [Lewinella sp.]